MFLFFSFSVLPFAAKSLLAYSRLSITRIVQSIGVTSFRLAFFLPACRRNADRNRGPGRVPGSPRNLSIRPTRSPPRRPPTYSFFASVCLFLFLSFSPFPPLQLSSTTVRSSIYTRSFDSSPSIEFSPLASPIPSVSFQLLHRRYFFIFVTILSLPFALRQSHCLCLFPSSPILLFTRLP